MLEVNSTFLHDKFLVLYQHIISNKFYTLNAIYYVSNIFRTIIFLAVGMGYNYESFDYFVRLGVIRSSITIHEVWSDIGLTMLYLLFPISTDW